MEFQKINPVSYTHLDVYKRQEFTLNADGTITQKNKTQENKLIYDATKMEFVNSKKK